VLLFLAAIALAGCVATVKSTGAWQGTAPHQTFSKVLVVGVTPNYTQRCAFEWALASRINTSSTQALVSCDSMTSDVPLTRENIERVVASTKADAVLATALVEMKLGSQEGGGRDTRGGAYYKATDYGYVTYADGYGVYGMPVVYADFQTAPTITTLNGEVHLRSKLYETHGATLVYTVETEGSSKDIESSSSSISSLAAPIAERLRNDRLTQ
jgi:predicted membrane-bound mannosyltransferase